MVPCPCPPGFGPSQPLKLTLLPSTACDWCFASRNTANLDASIQNIWNNVATQYDEEINVEIVIDETIKLTAKDSTSWNTMNRSVLSLTPSALCCAFILSRLFVLCEL